MSGKERPLAAPESGAVSVQGMLPYLDGAVRAENIHVYGSLESTNKTAAELAAAGCPDGTVVIADSQTAGRGRYGRSFYSPAGDGLYMTVVLRPPEIAALSAAMITAASAVLVCRAIEAVMGEDSDIKAKIKWVNDIVIDGKKVCGILTEAVTDFKSGNIRWAAVGIGVNVYAGGFPAELEKTAAALYGDRRRPAARSWLAAEIVNRFLPTDNRFKAENFIGEYRARMALLGREIKVYQQGRAFDAVAVGVDDACRLIIMKRDGGTAALSSGEVSVRLNRPGCSYEADENRSQ